ncbi:MAG: hypothetical protein V2J51_15820 [Erythrobacter sp.]|nr:hypothetical protein [Erythrobacter sp.]
MKVFQRPDGQRYILSDPDDDVIEFLEASFESEDARVDIGHTGECWFAAVILHDRPGKKRFLNFVSYEDDYRLAKCEIYTSMIEALRKTAEGTS